MSSHTCASYADVITWKAIQRICPRQSAMVNLALSSAGLTLGTWLAALYYEDRTLLQDEHPGLSDQRADELMKLFVSLNEAFEKATAVGGKGLTLCPCHASDAEADGEGAKLVDGGFFHVEGAYDLTPAGRKFRKRFTRVFYATFG